VLWPQPRPCLLRLLGKVGIASGSLSQFSLRGKFISRLEKVFPPPDLGLPRAAYKRLVKSGELSTESNGARPASRTTAQYLPLAVQLGSGLLLHWCGKQAASVVWDFHFSSREDIGRKIDTSCGSLVDGSDGIVRAASPVNGSQIFWFGASTLSHTEPHAVPQRDIAEIPGECRTVAIPIIPWIAKVLRRSIGPRNPLLEAPIQHVEDACRA
jgi:hypothetical protein